MAVALLRNGERMYERLRRWFSDESGQDLIEYLLLGAFVSIAGWVSVQLLENAMNSSYQSWDAATQSIWEVPEPVDAGS